MQQWLTQSPTFHFLCRNRKNREYLNHNLHDYVSHSRGRGNASVYLELMEEAFDEVKNVNEFVSERTSIFSRLRDRVKIGRIWTK